MKHLKIIALSLLLSTISFAQETEKVNDSTATQLQEVILIGKRKLSTQKQEKTLSSIDEYLEKSGKITMIKRGNYAWETSINNMVTERISVTIDGMQIYGACTDKMDPTTSYVDVSNLEKVTINSGQEGTENNNCIGGAVNLNLTEPNYNNSGLKSNIDFGYETNGNYKSTSLDMEYSGEKFYINTDGIFRKSDNYDTGNNNEILYSQFQKYNLSLQTGFKMNSKNSIEANIIYDRATDVGYPALPMDVSLAEAKIGALTHIFKNDSAFIKKWETKVYANSITHIMDDSKRPIVPIRMDMPGWSDTYGMFSKVNFNIKKHHISANLSGHYNRSLAEMIMYPNDPSENEMFMYTWPDIHTLNSGVYLKDEYHFKHHKKLSFSTRMSHHQNEIKNETGLKSLRIFYPEMEAKQTRFLSSFNTDYTYVNKNITYRFGIGYGERAPSISEGYGFYLFNSSDRYDYIGNPNLKNEKAYELNFASKYKKGKFELGFETAYFHIKNYIIGEIDTSLFPMTIDANGVRTYNALDYANIFSSAINLSYPISENLTFSGNMGYNYGKESNQNNLPLIRPFAYGGELAYQKNKFNVALQLDANSKQTQYSKPYGELETASYAVVHLNFGNQFYIQDNRTILKYGIENIFDTYYSTYADWNNIPRQGRNFYLNVSYIIK